MNLLGRSKGGFGAAFVASGVVYLGLGGLLIFATTRAGHSISHPEEDIAVSFQAPPPPPPPAPVELPPQVVPRTAAPAPRPRALEIPKAIPTEVKPSTRVEAAEPGVPGGVEGGTGTAEAPAPIVPAAPPPPVPVTRRAGPVQLPENAIAPVPSADNLAPQYPSAARAAGIQATVILKIVVRADGSVGDVEVMRGDEQLNSAAIEAVRQWRFSPATLDGEPITVFRVIRIPFRLTGL